MSKQKSKEGVAKKIFGDKGGKRERKSIKTQESLIGIATSLVGDLESEKSIRIDGKITGDIRCQGCITVGEKGCVNGNLYAETIVVYGKIEGTVEVSGRLEIMDKGEMCGDINTKCLVVQPGGIFSGQSKMCKIE